MSEIRRYLGIDVEGIGEAEGWGCGLRNDGDGSIEVVLFSDHLARVKGLEDALRGTVNVIENLYPDQFYGDVESEHENEVRVVYNVLLKARAALGGK